MIIKQRGFIFIIVLLFFQIFTLLGLFGLLLAKHELKKNVALWQNDLCYHKINDKLITIERLLMQEDVSCMISVISPNTLKKMSVNWWQSHACRDKTAESTSYFVIESLGEDPCANIEIDHHPQENLIADYYRITLMSEMINHKEDDSLLQSIIVKAKHSKIKCNELSHPVLIGRQMLREI